MDSQQSYTQYEGPQLSIEVWENFLSVSESEKILSKILSDAPLKKGLPSKRRNKLIFGDSDFPEYTIVYRGKTIKTPVLSWSKLPILETLRDKIAQHTGQPYNTCVIQIYSSGQVGIKPHRDKEVNKGTIIASISLGETRVMRFERHGM